MIQIKSEFKNKYPYKQIKSVTVDAEREVLEVYTTDPRIWVDLPERFKGFYVDMKVVSY